MPRDGSGRAHNEVEGNEIVHGAGDKDVSKAISPQNFMIRLKF
jgi:hypothetical protein